MIMQGYHQNFERGFMLYYPDALGEGKGMIFALYRRAGANAWDAYLDADGDVAMAGFTAPPCLYLPAGAIGRCWYGQQLERVLGFALDEQAEGFKGSCQREVDGWAVADTYGRILYLLERGNAPNGWTWAGMIDEFQIPAKTA